MRWRAPGTDDARNNTDTNPNSDGTGEAIYWVRGEKAADNYSDFYNGSWDSYARVWEDGTLVPGDDQSIIWTGCKSNGTEDSLSGSAWPCATAGARTTPIPANAWHVAQGRI